MDGKDNGGGFLRGWRGFARGGRGFVASSFGFVFRVRHGALVGSGSGGKSRKSLLERRLSRVGPWAGIRHRWLRLAKAETSKRPNVETSKRQKRRALFSPEGWEGEHRPESTPRIRGLVHMRKSGGGPCARGGRVCQRIGKTRPALRWAGGRRTVPRCQDGFSGPGSPHPRIRRSRLAASRNSS